MARRASHYGRDDDVGGQDLAVERGMCIRGQNDLEAQVRRHPA
jgi:hypothetical protein